MKIKTKAQIQIPIIFLGNLIIIVSIILMIANVFYLQETSIGYTSMTFEHSMIMMLCGINIRLVGLTQK